MVCFSILDGERLAGLDAFGEYLPALKRANGASNRINGSAAEHLRDLDLRGLVPRGEPTYRYEDGNGPATRSGRTG